MGAGEDIPRVLLVEDDAVEMEKMRAALAPLDAALYCAGTVADGIRIAQAIRPDVAVIDLALPDGDGYDLMAQMKADPDLSRRTAVIVIYPEMPPVERVFRGHQLGTDCQLVRPVHLVHLVHLVLFVARILEAYGWTINDPPVRDTRYQR